MGKMRTLRFFVLAIGSQALTFNLEGAYEPAAINGQLPTVAGLNIVECNGPWWTPTGGDGSYLEHGFAVYEPIKTDGTATTVDVASTACGLVLGVSESDTEQVFYVRIAAVTEDILTEEGNIYLAVEHCEGNCGLQKLRIASLPHEESLYVYTSQPGEQNCPDRVIACAAFGWDNDSCPGGEGGNGSAEAEPFYSIAVELDESLWTHPENSAISSMIVDRTVCGDQFNFWNAETPDTKLTGIIAGTVNDINGRGLYSLSVPADICEELCPGACAPVAQVISRECHIVTEVIKANPPEAGTVGATFVPSESGLPTIGGKQLLECQGSDWTSGTDGIVGGKGVDYRDGQYAIALSSPPSGSIDALSLDNSCQINKNQSIKITGPGAVRWVQVAAYEVTEETAYYYAIPEDLCEEVCGKSCLYRVCSDLSLMVEDHVPIPEHLEVFGMYKAERNAPPTTRTGIHTFEICPDSSWEGEEATGGDGKSEYSNYAYVAAVEAPEQSTNAPGRLLSVPKGYALESACGDVLLLHNADSSVIRYAEVAAFADDLFYNTGLYGIEISHLMCEAVGCLNDCTSDCVKVTSYVEDIAVPRDGEVTVSVNAMEDGPCYETTCNYVIGEGDEGCGGESNPCPAIQRGEIGETVPECGNVFSLRSAEVPSPSDDEKRELYVKVVSYISDSSTIAGFDVSHFGWENLCPNVCVNEGGCKETCDKPSEPYSYCSCKQEGATADGCNDCADGCYSMPGSGVERLSEGSTRLTRSAVHAKFIEKVDVGSNAITASIFVALILVSV